MSASSDTTSAVQVVVYSSNRRVRAQILSSLGKRPSPQLPPFEYAEFATEPALFRHLDQGGVDLVILDGEAYPGGMGIARQMKDEIYQCPPSLLITGRPQDAWLATWSRADAVIPRPISQFDLARAAVELVRQRLASTTA